MVGYKAIEDAFIARMLAVFPDKLNENRIKAGDPDSVFDAIFTEGATYGVILEFAGGRQDPHPVMSKIDWRWVISGIFVILYTGVEVEADVREIASRLADILNSDPRLGSTTPLARVSEVGVAEPTKVNDTPFYWLPFSVEAFDR